MRTENVSLALFAGGGIVRAGVEVGGAALRFDLVGAEAFLGQQTIHHQIAESAGVAAGLPDRAGA